MPRSRLPRSYATIAATFALVTALGGTSYAVTLITTKQIKDNTIQNRDIRSGTIRSDRIKDGTLQVSDLAPSTRTAAYSVHSPGGANIGNPGVGGDPVVLTLDIPNAGSYAIFAKLVANDVEGTSAFVRCTLHAEADSDETDVELGPTGADTSFVAALPFQVVHTYTAPGTAFVDCVQTAVEVDVSYASITAISVASITESTS